MWPVPCANNHSTLMSRNSRILNLVEPKGPARWWWVINVTTSPPLPQAKTLITYRTVGLLGGRAGPDVLENTIVDVTLKYPVHNLVTAQTTLTLLIMYTRWNFSVTWRKYIVVYTHSLADKFLPRARGRELINDTLFTQGSRYSFIVCIVIGSISTAQRKN